MLSGRALGLWAVASLAAIAGGAYLTMPVGGDMSREMRPVEPRTMSSTTVPAAPPAVAIDVAFLHHSVGSQLLASPGAEGGTRNGVPTHPNGGGLAALLASAGYRLHEATYGSDLGEHTDLFDWLPKFRTRMDDILAIRHQNERLPDGTRNRVVVFKSCFPNNDFVGVGDAPGSPAGPQLTEWNARATLTALLDETAKHPDVLFVYLTAPPMAPRTWEERRWKQWVKRAMGRPTHEQAYRAAGASARRFNTWVTSPDGWLAGYAPGNVVVFDLYGYLTDDGVSDFSRYATLDGTDSHPSSAGNSRVAPALVAFLNRVVREKGLTP